MSGIISRSFWRHNEIRKLSTDAKLLCTYLLTSPHHELIGCYYLPLEYIAADLKWNPKQTKQAADLVSGCGFAIWCPVTDYVLVPKWLRYHPIQNPNQGYARLNQVNALPSGFSHWELLLQTFHRRGGKHLSKIENWEETFERFTDADVSPDQQSLNGMGNGSATIESERERDNESESESESTEVGAKKPDLDELFEACFQIYPSRGGAGNSKKAGFRAFCARIRAGVLYEDLFTGTVRYRAWCDHVGNTGTKFAKAASTFYGPDEHWTGDYTLDKQGRAISQSRLQSAWNEIEDSIKF